MGCISLFFDGAAPGNGKGTVPAYGSFIVSGDKKPTRVEHNKVMTGNQAEYATLIAGLKYAERKMHVRAPKTDLRVFCDSRLVVHQMSGEFKCKNPDLRKFRDQALEIAGKFANVRYIHVERKEAVRVFGH